jgi:hypothetical protein
VLLHTTAGRAAEPGPLPASPLPSPCLLSRPPPPAQHSTAQHSTAHLWHICRLACKLPLPPRQAVDQNCSCKAANTLTACQHVHQSGFASTRRTHERHHVSWSSTAPDTLRVQASRQQAAGSGQENLGNSRECACLFITITIPLTRARSSDTTRRTAALKRSTAQAQCVWLPAVRSLSPRWCCRSNPDSATPASLALPWWSNGA